MTSHPITKDATGNPIYELDMVEYMGKWYVVHKFKGDYILKNDEKRLFLFALPQDEIYLVEHF